MPLQFVNPVVLALRPQHISWLFHYNIKTIRTLSYIFPLFDSDLPAISRSHNGSCYHFIHKFEKLNSVTVFWANESFTGSVSNSISSISSISSMRRELFPISSLYLTLIYLLLAGAIMALAIILYINLKN